MVAAATIGAAVVGAAASSHSARQEGKRADRRARTELGFAQERYDDWQAIYGPIQENLASYYNNLTPEFIEAQGLEAYEKEKDAAVKEIEASFAQRGISTSGIAADVEKDIAIQSAESRAKIRAEAPMKAAMEKSRFLQIGLGQNPANSVQQVLSNQANQAAQQSLMANQAAGEATQNAVETIFDVWEKVTNMLGAFIGKGLSTGAKEGYSSNFTEEAKARRAEAKALKEQRNQQLEQLQATKPSKEDYANMKTVQSQELELLKQQNKQAIAQNAQMMTYQGFDRFIDSGYDPRQLNSMLADLKRNPIAGPMYKDFIRVDKVTEQDKALLTQAGLDPELILNNPEIAKQFVKTTRADGSARIDDITELMKQTGYYRYAKKQELARQTEAAKQYNAYVQYGAKTENERIAVRKAIGDGLKPGTPEFENAVAEETERLKREFPTGRQTGKPGSAEYEYRTKDEREALRRTQEEYGIRPGDEGFEDAYNQTYDSIVRRNRETAVGKQEARVDESIDEISKIDAQNSLDFFTSPEVLTDPKVRRLYEREIEQIERFGKLNLSETEKKELRDISVLIGLGDPASEITDRETGIIDNTLRGFKKYVSDEVGGAKATSSYAAFRNATRHALYGAALTEAEIRSFNQAFGTLGQQLGPVLQQFTTSLNQVKSKLESIDSMNNSYVTRFRLGMSQEQLQSTINAVNQRLEYISRVSSGSTKPVQTELSNEEFQEMDALYQEFLNEN